MTMDFKPANDALLAGLKPGAAIAFEFVERSPGRMGDHEDRAAQRMPPAPTPSLPAHQGH